MKKIADICKCLYFPQMPDTRTISISGKALLAIRKRLVLSRIEFGRQIGLGTTRLQQIEKAEQAQVFPDVIQALSRLTGDSPEEVVRKLGPPPADENVEPYSEEAVPDIPLWDLAIAAGPWLELPMGDEISDLTIHRDGRFRVLIRGDSMEKDYPDGSLVEFRCLRPDCGDGKGARLEVGADYYVQRAESATFKRLESFDNDMLVFKAVNKRKYPEQIEVLRADISRMAKAEFILKKVNKR